MDEYTICELCSVLHLDKMNELYELLLQNSINPLKIKRSEISKLIFGKTIKNFNPKQIFVIPKRTPKKELPEEHIVFLGKQVVYLKEDEMEKINSEKEELLKKCENIILDLNKTKEEFFKEEGRFKCNPSVEALIKKWLNKGYGEEDFYLVHKYTALNYIDISKTKDFDAKKFFRPQTLYNNKFEFRVEEAKSYLADIEEKIKSTQEIESEVEEILDILDQKRKQYFPKNVSVSKRSDAINKKMIADVIDDGFSKEDIVDMFDYIAELYLSNKNKKIRSGDFYRVQTLFNKDFPSRIANTLNWKKTKEKESQNEDALQAYLKEMAAKRK